MNNDVAEFDLGVGVEDTNHGSFFEQFHKNQTPSTKLKPVNLDNPNPPAQDQNKTGNQQNSNQQANPDKSANNPDQTPVDKNVILDLIKEQQNAKNGATADKTAGGVAGANSIVTMYEHLTQELGFPALPDGTTFEGTDESFNNWIQDVVQDMGSSIADKMITEAFASQKHNEPLAKDFFKFLANGGSVEDFIQTRKHEDIAADYLTVTDEGVKSARSEKIIRDMHSSMGWDLPSIDAYIMNLKKSGTLETLAETALPQFIKINSQKKAQADQQAVATKQKTETEIREHNTKVFDAIDNNKEFMGFNIASPKEKQRIKEYMYVPSVDFNGTKVPQFIVDKANAAKNPNYTLLQALTHLYKGLDLTGIKNKVENNVKSSLKDRLEAAALGKKIEQPASSQNGNTKTESPQNYMDFDNLQFAT